LPFKLGNQRQSMSIEMQKNENLLTTTVLDVLKRAIDGIRTRDPDLQTIAQPQALKGLVLGNQPKTN